MNENQALPWDNPRFRNWIAVGRACQAMQSVVGRALQPLNLKLPHLDILANVYRRSGITQQELATKMLVGRSNVSMLLPQLEKRGLIERRSDERDKRVLRLYLTGEGMTLAEEALAIQAEIIESTMDVATLEECTMVGDVMNRLVERLIDPEPAARLESGIEAAEV